ncbi:guanylate kinase [Candidatus Woesearchaeota archaeon]|nr:guanylate kinase [Candidatus Woesearchaeota archaeon]
MKKGNIFFVIGPTASGKTVIINYILKNKKNILRAISYTTREKRPREINGIDYFFVSEEEFKNLIKQNKFIEYSKVYGNYYGTGKDSFSKIEEGYDVIKIIDYKGAKKFKNSGIKAKYFFFAPEDIETLIERLKQRGDKDIEERIKVYKEEMKFKKECDYYIDTSGSSDSDIAKRSNELIKIIDNIDTT